MPAWWTNLKIREQRLIALGAVISFFLIFYTLILSPLASHNQELRDSLQNKVKLIEWMQVTDAKIRKHQKQNSSHATGSSILSIVQNQLNSDELQKHVTEMKQNENNAVYLNLHNLQFEKLATFLATISKEEHLTITRLSLVPVNKKGIVNAEVEMKT